MIEPLDPGALFIGVGHPLRGDDGVGPWLAEALAARGFNATAQFGDGSGLIPMFEPSADVVIVDATQSGAAPGTLTRFDGADALPKDPFRNSTHEFGLAAAVEMARILGGLPRRLTIYGIEGRDFGLGSAMTEEVVKAAEELLEQLAPA
ncbi:MAG: hydrogenase maturation protease [Paracoccaceae bacterium]|nr:hydrogenase maturation protease [Paracoccaceae bacterium]